MRHRPFTSPSLFASCSLTQNEPASSYSLNGNEAICEGRSKALPLMQGAARAEASRRDSRQLALSPVTAAEIRRKRALPFFAPRFSILALVAALASFTGDPLWARNFAGRIPLPTGPADQPAAGGNSTIPLAGGGSAVIRQPAVVSGRFDPGFYVIRDRTATLTQGGEKGILRWGSFDIDNGYSLVIVQPSSTSTLLNKIEGNASPSLIQGVLNANGQVYIYNPNGVIFGAGGSINVNTLVATTLKIDDQRFLAGLLSSPTAAAFKAEANVTPGNLEVDNGASITANGGGKIILVGANVSNSGTLSAADGQVLMAAGNAVYLLSPADDDFTLRGLRAAVGGAGTVTNALDGRIAVERGNATLIAQAVNQEGHIKATTAVAANGSIYLKAVTGNVTLAGQTLALNENAAGTLTLGANSVTEILPDTATASATATADGYRASEVVLKGDSVLFRQNARIVAPGGNVSIATGSAVASTGAVAANGITRGNVLTGGVYMESGASIDVSGLRSAELEMSSNVVKVELRGSELADAPRQRNSSVLRGKTVYVDRRKGTPLADISAWLSRQEYAVDWHMSTGGNVTFNAEQGVTMAEGSSVNVSGGAVNYKDGYVATSQLRAGRRTVDISAASPDWLYTAVYDGVANPRNFERGYSEGRDAGSVSFNASALLLRGGLYGLASAGPQQRDSATAPRGGRLLIGALPAGPGYSITSNYLGVVDFGGQRTAGIATPAFDRPWYQPDDAGMSPQLIAQMRAEMHAIREGVDVDTDRLAANGFTRIGAYARDGANGAEIAGQAISGVTVSRALHLAPGGEFRASAAGPVRVNANIVIPGGVIDLKSTGDAGAMVVADNLSFDVAGLWTNDRTGRNVIRDAVGNPVTPVVLQGGDIRLASRGSVSVGDNVVFDASGGAWQDVGGKMSSGKGGSISLAASALDSLSPETASLKLGAGVRFAAYGISQGGTLELSGRNVRLGAVLSAADDPLDLVLANDFFAKGGFAKYSINAAGNLTVAATAAITPRAENWLLGRDTRSVAGGRMSDAFDLALLPLAGAQGARSASSLSLSAQAQIVAGSGVLKMEQGASISTDPGGSVSLSAGRLLDVGGRISAPGGSVNLMLSNFLSDANTINFNIQNPQFHDSRAVWLRSGAVVDVAGTNARLWQTRTTQGDLLGGGTIRIGLDRDPSPSSVTDAGFVAIEQGARLDASGAAAQMLLPNLRSAPRAREVASTGGSIDIRAADGIFIEGDLSAAGGNGRVAGGTLNVALDRHSTAGAPLDLVVLDQSRTVTIPTGLHTGDALPTAFKGKAQVLASTLSSGFERVSLKSQNNIVLDTGGGNLSLNARTRIALDAPVFKVANAAPGTQVSIQADTVALGNSDYLYQTAGAAAVATAGNATLNVAAGNVDIVGSSAVQGVGTTNINATRDIRLAGVVGEDMSQTFEPHALHAIGALKTAGTANFTSAQLYPATMSEFTLDAGTGTINFIGNGNVVKAPLSAAGTLTVKAGDIHQRGVVRAPFGSLTFIANNVSFDVGSLTSVIGSGKTPLGRIENGRDWVYDFGYGWNVTLNNPRAGNSVTLPEKMIRVDAQGINIARGATLDLSGGGDLHAYEFTAGPGGSRDILARGVAANGQRLAATSFAILPDYDNGVAPLDFQNELDNSDFKVGQRIYLSGMPGLAAGYYTVLPAHYALLDGAYMVSAVADKRDLVAGYTQLDGSRLVSGYLNDASGGGESSRRSGFSVLTSAQVRERSGYTDYSGNNLGLVATSRPNNGGHLSLNAAQSLALDGTIRLAAHVDADGVKRGDAGIADISAPEILLVNAKSGNAAPGVIELAVGDLAAMQADSLMLGGTRQIRSDGVQATIGANKVTMADGTHLAAPEIILAARDTVAVGAGATIAGAGSGAVNTGDINIVGSGADADGALLRVSAGSQAAVIRNAPDRNKGTLSIAAGAVLGASGAMMLDATKSLDVKGQLDLADKAALGIGANRISLGDGMPADVPNQAPTLEGLRLDGGLLARLNRVADLSLSSYTTFDVYGVGALGGANTQSLSLRGAGIQAYEGTGGNGNSLMLTAKTVRFDSGGKLAGAPGQTAADGSTGSMNVQARDIEVGSGAFAVKGYAAANLNATREFRAVGKTGNIVADRDMTIAAGTFTAATGASGGAQSLQTLKLSSNVADKEAAVTTGSLGGKLSFAAANALTSEADILAHAGVITLQGGSGGLAINGGTLDASGLAKTFGSTTAYAPGGNIILDGGSGNVVVAAAATLDVSAVGADAGLLSVTAKNGTATLGGKLKGASVKADGSVSKTTRQGRFALDVATLGTLDFGALNAVLGARDTDGNASGFTEARQFRVRNGDLALGAADTVTAHEVVISADNGNLTIAGTIDAAGAKGGSIELYASTPTLAAGKGKLTVASGAVLDAHATTAASGEAGSTGDGGRIVLGTSVGGDGAAPTANDGPASINVESGATFKVNGSGLGQNGSVTLRAPRIAGNTDVAIKQFGATVVGGNTSIEAYKVYYGAQDIAITSSATTSNAGGYTNIDVAGATGAAEGIMFSDASAFAGNFDAIQARLGLSPAQASISPGMEVRAGRDITVSVNENLVSSTSAANRGWNLNTWRFNGQPGVLTLRAGRDLTVAGSISDGFVKPTSPLPTASGGTTACTSCPAMPAWALSDSPKSWSYRFAAGADMAAADMLSVIKGTGNFNLNFDPARKATASSTALGDMLDRPVALIRTGTGDIDIAAGMDVKLDAVATQVPTATSTSASAFTPTVLGATIYTAGYDAGLESGFAAPRRQIINPIYSDQAALTNLKTVGTQTPVVKPGFGTAGGDLRIEAGHDVIGALNLFARQSVNDWLFRRGAVDGDGLFADRSLTTVDNISLQFLRYENLAATGWWIRYDYFNQGMGALGGGDVAVVAGNNVSNLSLSLPTVGQLPADAGNRPTTLVEHGGGDLTVRAGNDIRGGSYYVQKGEALLVAGGGVVAGDNTVTLSGQSPVALRPIFALGDGEIRVTALNNVELETVYNPTLAPQSSYNADASSSTLLRRSHLSSFSTYGDGSGIALTSVVGDVEFGNHASALNSAFQPWLSAQTDGYKLYLVYPASVYALALSRDIGIDNGFTLSPSSRGRLNLLAGRSIDIRRSSSSDAQGIVMLDVAPLDLYTPARPYMPSFAKPVPDLLKILGEMNGIINHSRDGLHAGDAEPVRMVALTGDISGVSESAGPGAIPTDVLYTLMAPKKVEIMAGGDIRDFGFKIQHLADDDVSTIVAGRDFIDSSYFGINKVRHYVSGPGRLDMFAGRNIDFGTSGGLVSRGNMDNPYLPGFGASLNLFAGAKPDYAGMAALLSNRDNFSGKLMAAYDQRALIAYVAGRTPGIDLPARLAEFDSQTAIINGQDKAAALAAQANRDRLIDGISVSFNTLPDADRAAFLTPLRLNDVFFAALGSIPNSALLGNLDASKVPASVMASLAAYVGSIQPGAPSSGSGLLRAFRALDPWQQINYLMKHDVPLPLAANSELRTFDAIIAALFPTASIGRGDINVFGSQIKTASGGSVNLFAPGGSIQAGLTAQPAWLKLILNNTASPSAKNYESNLGIYTIGPVDNFYRALSSGNLQALVGQDFLVNRGRVFSLGGGDIILASQYGNIDAGKGAKTSSATPPPRLLVDADGNATLDVSGAVSGSGVRSMSPYRDMRPASIITAAPRGFVDAGDAGIGATGDVRISAALVKNAENITAGGQVSGAGRQATAAPPALPQSTETGARQNVAGDAVSDPSKANNLTVDLLGFGGSGGSSAAPSSAPAGNAAPNDSKPASRRPSGAGAGTHDAGVSASQTSDASSTDQRKRKTN